MDFDFPIAIAKLDAKLGTENLNTSELRARYPELGFLFDRLEEFEELAETTVPKGELTYAEGQIERLQENLEDCAQRFAQIRDMAITLSQFDSAQPIKSLVDTLASKADDGQVWADRMATL